MNDSTSPHREPANRSSIVPKSCPTFWSVQSEQSIYVAITRSLWFTRIMSKRCPRVRYHSGDAYSALIACWAQSERHDGYSRRARQWFNGPGRVVDEGNRYWFSWNGRCKRADHGKHMSFCSTTPQRHFMLISAHLCWILAEFVRLSLTVSQKAWIFFVGVVFMVTHKLRNQRFMLSLRTFETLSERNV